MSPEILNTFLAMYEAARAEQFAPNSKLDAALKFALDNKATPHAVLAAVKERFPNEELPEDLQFVDQLVKDSDALNPVVGNCPGCGKQLNRIGAMQDAKGVYFCMDCWRADREVENKQRRKDLEDIHDSMASVGEKLKPCTSCGRMILKREEDMEYAKAGYCVLCYQDAKQQARELFEQAASDNFSSIEQLARIAHFLSEKKVRFGAFLATIRGSALSCLDSKAMNDFLEHGLEQATETIDVERWEIDESIRILDQAVKRINDIETILGLNPQSCFEIDQEVKYLRSVLDARKGKLPVCSPSIILPAGEIMHCEVQAEFTEPVDSDPVEGKMYITNQRVIFLSDQNRFEFPHYRTVSVTGYGSSVGIELSSGYGSGDYGTTSNELIAEILEWLAKTANRQVLDSPTGASRAIPQLVKIEVWQRDQGRCVQCGAQEYLEYDHIIPFSMGGATSVSNLQLLCRKCNISKSARL